MNTCDTCKHWKEPEHSLYDSEGNPVESMSCDSPKLIKFHPPERDGASLMDGSYYRAVMHTGPKFGCINHEQKS